jgi:hypothetical protein
MWYSLQQGRLINTVMQITASIMASAAWFTQHATATLEVSACHFIKISYCIINATSSCQGCACGSVIRLLSGVGVVSVLCLTSRLLVTGTHAKQTPCHRGLPYGRGKAAAQTVPRRRSAAHLAHVGMPPCQAPDPVSFSIQGNHFVYNGARGGAVYVSE